MVGALSSVPTWADQQVVSWDGGAGTLKWSDANNWNPDVVPDNGAAAGTTYVVTIGDSGAGADFNVDLDVDVAIDSLTVALGDQLDINDGRILTVGNLGGNAGYIVNSGLITLNSAGSVTALQIRYDVSLRGGGLVLMSNSTQNLITGTGETPGLGNVDNLIAGAGQIGVNVLTFANQGTVIANRLSPLTIDAPSFPGQMSNSGTLRATAGATLNLEGGTYMNRNGVIEADSSAASTINLNGATIDEGTVQLTGALGNVMNVTNSAFVDCNVFNNFWGSIRFLAGTTTIARGLYNLGELRIDDAAELVLFAGSHTNRGTIFFNSSGSSSSQTTLRIKGDVTLEGDGRIQLSHSRDRIVGTEPTDRLVSVYQTIVGGGEIGQNTMAFTNGGSVRANLPTPLIIDPTDSEPFVNTGTLYAVSALMMLAGGTYQNTGNIVIDFGAAHTTLALTGAVVQNSGKVQLYGSTGGQDGGLLRLEGSRITGSGIVEVVQNGTIQALSGSNALSGNVTNQPGGEIRVESGTELLLTAGSTYNNSGVISINSGPAAATLRISGGDVTLTGQGSVLMPGSALNRIIGTVPTDRLVNKTNTILGTGQVGAGSMDFLNEGTVLANSASGLTLDAADGSIENKGNLSVSAGSLLSLGAGDTYLQTSGTSQVDGLFSASSGLVDVRSGVLRGLGTISARVLNAGQMAPGSSPGIFTITESYDQTSAGSLTVEIGGAVAGSQYDRLAVSGEASLAGHLWVSLINGFTPLDGQAFTILTSTGITGNFLGVPDGEFVRATLSGGGFTVRYLPVGAPTSVTLTFHSANPGGCTTPVIVVPDGRTSERASPAAGGTAWFAATLHDGRSYSLELSSISGSVAPGTATVFSGDNGCGGASSISTRDTSAVDPPASPGTVRLSFKAASTNPFFRIRLNDLLGVGYTIRLAETTMFSPAWSTNGSYDTYYSIHNTTGATLTGTLVFSDVNGATVATFGFAALAGRDVRINTLALGVPRGTTGTVALTHDGPPGSAAVDAVIANLAVTPAYAQPVRFDAIRESR